MRAGSDTNFFGVSNEHESITVWDALERAKVCVARPGFKGGRERFVIDPCTSKIFSGTWEAGLTCYDYGLNKVLWRRRDLIGIQKVDISPVFPDSLFISLETPDHRTRGRGMFTGIVELERASGKSGRWAGSYFGKTYLHPFSPFFIVIDGAKKMVRVMDGDKKILVSVQMANFAVLDATFDKDKVALAEGKMGVRVVDLEGKVVSSYCPSNRHPNCCRVAFDSSNGMVAVSDSWDGAFVTIIDPATGRVVHEYQGPAGGDICFINDGRSFLDARGQIFRTADGVPEWSISP